MKHFLQSGLLIVLFTVSTAGPVQAAANPLSLSLGQVEIADTTLAEAIDYFQIRSQELDPAGAGVNIIVDPAVDGERRVALHLSSATVGTALICLIDHAELDYKIEPYGFLVLPPGKGELMARRLKQQPSAPSIHATRSRQLVLEQIEFDEAPIGDVLEYVAAKSREGSATAGFNLVLNHTVDPELPVTLRLRGVPAAQVFAYLSRKTAVEIRDEPWAIFVDPPGTKAFHEAQRKAHREALAAENETNRNKTFRGKGYGIGSYPADPRSPAHPDYVGSAHGDVRLRTNALNNVYKWVGGKWTFVRYGSGDKNQPSLNPDGTRLITPTLNSRD